MTTLTCESSEGPARIKNLSAGGALLNTRQHPAVGEVCRIERGEVAVRGRILRVTPWGVAMQFFTPIVVPDWMGAPRREQREVDRHVEEARHRYPVADSAHIVTKLQTVRRELRPSAVGIDGILEVAGWLDRLADALADDPAIVARYGPRLQVLDIASQRLRALAPGGLI